MSGLEVCSPWGVRCVPGKRQLIDAEKQAVAMPGSLFWLLAKGSRGRYLAKNRGKGARSLL